MAAALAMTLSAAAQPAGGERPEAKQRPTVEQEARARADKMVRDLSLNEKEAKKVYKFMKKDIKYRRENFEIDGSRGEGRFIPPMRDGGGFPGGSHGEAGAPGRGERPAMGGPGGQGGPGRPGMRPGNPPAGFGREVDVEALNKYNAKQDKKLRKIIGDEKFGKWRAAHPHKSLELQEPELKK